MDPATTDRMHVESLISIGGRSISLTELDVRNSQFEEGMSSGLGSILGAASLYGSTSRVVS